MPRKKKKAVRGDRSRGPISTALNVDSDSLKLFKGGPSNLELLARLDDLDIDFMNGKLCIRADVTKGYFSSKTTLVLIEVTPSLLVQLAALAMTLNDNEDAETPF